MSCLRTLLDFYLEVTGLTSRLPIAYVAGLIDGEGCIYINQTARGYLSTVVTVGMTTKALPILEALKTQFGGALNQHNRAKGKWDAAYAWRASGSDAVNVLRLILPDLMLKAEQARLGIRLEEIKAAHREHFGRPGSWTACSRQRCQTIRRRVMELNATGPVRPEPATPRGYRRLARHVAGHWVTEQADLFSDLGWASFSKTWPKSGLMLGGVLFEPATPGHRIAASASSSSPGLLPTPSAGNFNDGESLESWEARRQENLAKGINGNGMGTPLGVAVSLLPTPQAADARRGAESEIGGLRPSGAKRSDGLTTAVLLKTPTAQLAVNGGSQHPDKRREGGHGPTLADQVEHLLPTPNATDSQGGPRALPEKRTRQGKDHGPRLRDVAPTLLPTPDATHGRKTIRTSTLLAGIPELLSSGDPTSPPSADGKPSDARPPGQLSLDGLESG